MSDKYFYIRHKHAGTYWDVAEQHWTIHASNTELFTEMETLMVSLPEKGEWVEVTETSPEPVRILLDWKLEMWQNVEKTIWKECRKNG